MLKKSFSKTTEFIYLKYLLILLVAVCIIFFLYTKIMNFDVAGRGYFDLKPDAILNDNVYLYKYQGAEIYLIETKEYYNPQPELEKHFPNLKTVINKQSEEYIVSAFDYEINRGYLIVDNVMYDYAVGEKWIVFSSSNSISADSLVAVFVHQHFLDFHMLKTVYYFGWILFILSIPVCFITLSVRKW